MFYRLRLPSVVNDKSIKFTVIKIQTFPENLLVNWELGIRYLVKKKKFKKNQGKDSKSNYSLVPFSPLYIIELYVSRVRACGAEYSLSRTNGLNSREG